MLRKLNFLENLIENDSILLQQEASNWQEAIKLSTNLLEKAKIINQNYYLNILESTAKYGPYYVIMDGFAMPHASGTSDSVFGNGFSLVTLKNPVVFENNVKVSVFVCVAAIDGETHTKIAIPQLVAIFESPENIAKIASFQTKEQVIDFISKIDYTKYL